MANKSSGSQFEGLLLTPRQRSQAEKPPARSLAKSRDREYKPRTLYLRKKTYTECDYFLKYNEDPRDMSELVEELLGEFLAKSKR